MRTANSLRLIPAETAGKPVVILRAMIRPMHLSRSYRNPAILNL